MSDPEVIAETRRWLRYAREDLAEAARILDQQRPVCRHACWFAQQAAEKALKAGLVFLQTDFPRTHDLARLRNLLPEGWTTRQARADLAGLTEWAVESRYPGDWADTGPAEAESAIKSARAVLSAIIVDLRDSGFEA